MADTVFLIGPGGAGKSTVGRHLSTLLGYRGVDLDDEFCRRIMNIRALIKSQGYEAYLEQNALLLSQLLEQYAGQNTLFILSSGFLATDIRADIVERNKQLVSERGISVLLLPSRDYEKALDCIVTRQLQRGFGLVREQEQQKFRQRFYQYIEQGQIKIFSVDEPQHIARQIQQALSERDHKPRPQACCRL